MFALSHLSVNYLLPLWNPKSPAPSPLSKMSYKPQMPNVALGLIFLGHPTCTPMINFGHFFLFICLLIWLLAQPEEFRKVGGEVFFVPLQSSLQACVPRTGKCPVSLNPCCPSLYCSHGLQANTLCLVLHTDVLIISQILLAAWGDKGSLYCLSKICRYLVTKLTSISTVFLSPLLALLAPPTSSFLNKKRSLNSAFS